MAFGEMFLAGSGEYVVASGQDGAILPARDYSLCLARGFCSLSHNIVII